MPQRMNAADEVLGPPLAGGYAERPALLFEGGMLSYRELDSLVNRAANAIRRRGAAPGDRVLMLLNDSPAMVGAYLGAIRAGCVAVALNVRMSPPELLFAIEDSGAGLMLADKELIGTYSAVADQIGHRLDVVAVGEPREPELGLGDFITGAGASFRSEAMSPDDMALWIYTSGTTGQPKAAVHLHRNVLSAGPYLRECLGVRAGDRIFSTSRLFFAYALGNCVFGAFRLCATTILHRGWPEVESVARVVEATRPDVLFSVPTMYRKLLTGGQASQEGFSTVSAYASAGERLPVALAEQWHRTTGVRIFEGMGSSETVYMVFSNSPAAYRPGSSGKLAPLAEARLTDDEGGPIQEPDRAGRLWVKMPSTCNGYWNRQEVSHKLFVGPWFISGDLYSFDEEGFWYHRGRSDEMLKISGQWVAPAEIEECALNHPELADAAAVGATDAYGLTRLALFLVTRSPESDRERLAAEVRAHLLGQLSVHKCPRDMRFIEQVPRTATGKIQRYKLRDILLALGDDASG